MPSQLSRLEAKVDALLEKAGLKPDEVLPVAAEYVEPERTPAEQEALDNAPRVFAAVQPEPTERVDPNTNAPVTPAVGVPRIQRPETVPAPTPATVPEEAVGDVTVETTQPDGNTTVETKPAARTRAASTTPGEDVNWNSRKRT